jgi:hypothetical protein
MTMICIYIFLHQNNVIVTDIMPYPFFEISHILPGRNNENNIHRL